ncbi:hypothetical protein, partial [Bacillus altitudinis]|nr:hypothetical protein [Bacillus altitudinis]MEE4397311.1 hypothetical protein [Bacillus altitudinis]
NRHVPFLLAESEVKTMLDQNIDRLLWVIAAVGIVGAMIHTSDTEMTGLLEKVFQGFHAKIPKF